MTVDVPGLRPAVLPRQLLPALAVLRGFRHFLRHAYGVDLDLAHPTANGARALSIQAEINDAPGVFERFLCESVEPPGGPPSG